MTLILGIDPGSRITGYGVVRDTGRSCEYVASGCIRTGEGALPERLQAVFRGVSEVIRLHGPVTMGIEQVFMAKNADSALKLGQARGAAIVAGIEAGLDVSEYTATQVKQAIAEREHGRQRAGWHGIPDRVRHGLHARDRQSGQIGARGDPEVAPERARHHGVVHGERRLQRERVRRRLARTRGRRAQQPARHQQRGPRGASRGPRRTGSVSA